MNIKELSAKIDQKLQELDRQISATQKKLALQPEQQVEIKSELAKLEQIKAKLNQSKDIAQRAHDLQSGKDMKKMRKLNQLALFMIGFSVLGLIAIAIILIFY